MIYLLINCFTDWVQTGVTSFGRQFDFNDLIYHIQTVSLAMLTIDGGTLFLQLIDEQNVRKNMRFSPNKSYGKF